MFEAVKTYCDLLITEFGNIPPQRKGLLENISTYIISKQKENKPVNLIYICTHNSRRSQFGQVWAKSASDYFKIENINTFSGGTEATAFNINAINALKRVGFNVEAINSEKTSFYHVIYDDKEPPVVCYSKLFDDKKNPQNEFAAIMTCGEAEENCPFIPGAELRVGTTYEDPKTFDDTPLQDVKYDERCKQIAIETLYVFSKVK